MSIHLVNNGVYSFRSVEVRGEYLDVNNGKTENGNPLQTSPANFGCCQQFKALAEGNGFRLAFSEDDKKVIDILQNSKEVGICDSQSGDNQIWNIVFAGYSPLQNEYAIVNQSKNVAITAQGSKQTVTLEPFNPSNIPVNQKWKVYLEGVRSANRLTKRKSQSSGYLLIICYLALRLYVYYCTD